MGISRPRRKDGAEQIKEVSLTENYVLFTIPFLDEPLSYLIAATIGLGHGVPHQTIPLSAVSTDDRIGYDRFPKLIGRTHDRIEKYILRK
jgi:hypothetical protein